MRIVSENSDEDLKRREIDAEFRWAIRELAANLMRITRGSGKPHEIGRQAQDMINIIDRYRLEVGHFPWARDLSSHLDIWTGWDEREKLGEVEFHCQTEEERLLRAALQLVASRMLGQRLQESPAETELLLAIKSLGEAREERRKKIMGAIVARSPKPAKAAKAKRRTKRKTPPKAPL